MRAAITGGRHRVPTHDEMVAFWLLVLDRDIRTLAHGAARGTDRHVAGQARMAGLTIQPYPPDEEIDGPWPSAGNLRNERMLRSVDALTREPVRLLIAFPGRTGTADCVRRARRLFIPVEEV